MEQLWWKKPLRVIQTNLQVADTQGMDVDKIAREVADMHANALVTNVGGIYAWYPSDVPHHHVNEFLPKNFDLLRDLADACHRNGLRLIARFDFSKTDDVTFQRRPEWFVRDLEGKPKIIGRERFGNWSLLLSTCINAGYRNADFAAPVLDEVLDRYDIDGIFFNAPHYERCHCEACKRKYRALYGEELPEDPAHFRPDWASTCLRDNIGLLRGRIQQKRPEVPAILYYNLYRDNLDDRTATADMICTEPQDVLSLGWKNIPQSWKPALAIRLGCTVPDYPKPFGIIHSCPGMDWRHTGLPPAEYRYWLAQVPANGGQIWHSVTGYPDTIGDKRILDCVTEVNAGIEKTEEYMEGAVSAAEAVLIWNAKPSAEGLAEGLLAEHVQFDLLDTDRLTLQRLNQYRLAILPEDTPLSPDAYNALCAFVDGGGHVLAESSRPDEVADRAALFGVSEAVYGSEDMLASYIRVQDASLKAGALERTELLPHRGRVAYVDPLAGTRTLMTLVPPFAPLEAVGAPPERASLPTAHTDLPLAVLREDGRALLLTFSLSRLICDYKLAEHAKLLALCVRALIGGPQVVIDGASGVQAMLYRNGEDLLLHLVNGTGQRPLKDSVQLADVAFSVRLPAQAEYRAASVIAGEQVAVQCRGNRLYGVLRSLDAWDMLHIQKG